MLENNSVVERKNTLFSVDMHIISIAWFVLRFELLNCRPTASHVSHPIPESVRASALFIILFCKPRLNYAWAHSPLRAANWIHCRRCEDPLARIPKKPQRLQLRSFSVTLRLYPVLSRLKFSNCKFSSVNWRRLKSYNLGSFILLNNTRNLPSNYNNNPSLPQRKLFYKHKFSKWNTGIIFLLLETASISWLRGFTLKI